ncbi:MAG TPA: lysophospholipid acyltransferase family protein [Candidatus Paceibacterota bacterium]
MKSHSRFISFTYSVLRFILRPIIITIWVKEVTGVKNIPKTGGAIVALNHQSFLDFFAFAVVAPRGTHFLSAEKFFKKGLWKWLMILTGQIKVERNADDKSGVHSLVKKHIENGDLVGIFPEGTRSHLKDEMLKAFTGIAKYALEHRVPIIPVGIKGAHEIHSKESKRVKFIKTLEVHIGTPLHFPNHWEHHSDKEARTYVTEKAIKQIERLSGKRYPHYELKHDE